MRCTKRLRQPSHFLKNANKCGARHPATTIEVKYAAAGVSHISFGERSICLCFAGICDNETHDDASGIDCPGLSILRDWNEELRHRVDTNPPRSSEIERLWHCAGKLHAVISADAGKIKSGDDPDKFIG